MQSLLNEICLLCSLQDFHVVSIFVTTASTACSFQADLDNHASVCKFLADMAALRKKCPIMNWFLSFMNQQKLLIGSHCMAFSLSYLRQQHLFTGYLTNEKQTGANMRPQLYLRSLLGNLPFSYWPIFSLSLSTTPEVFAKVNQPHFSSRI